jgi:hypothetical protein
MRYAITTQFVSHDLPGFLTMASQQTPEEALCSSPITLCLKVHINHFAILIDCPPEVMLLAIDLYEDFVNEERVAIASVLSFQAASIDSPELDTPKADRFTADRDTAFGENVFDISMAEIESIVEPDSIGNDIRREAMAFVCIHTMILSISVT